MGLIRDSQGNYKCKGDITEQDILSTAETLLRVLDCQKLFIGTLDGASVHCREVIRAALDINAGAAILAHNHPSGVAEPSAADRALTSELVNALKIVGVRVLDHLVVTAGPVTSLAARGLM